MMSTIVVILLSTVVIELAILLHRARQALIVLAATKIHIREAKEEHWQVLHAIRQILLAQAELDERITPETLSTIRDTPEQFGKHGHWWYHMPSDYLELYWRDVPLPEKPPTPSKNGGQIDAQKRVLYEAGLM